MDKFTCIYCKKGISISQQTEEHVIPESLGSPLKIDNVCKKCNSIIGSELESELFSFHPIAGNLSELRIKSKSGRITPFVETGKRAKAKIKDRITGEEINTQMRLGFDGEFHKIIPTKTKPEYLIIDKAEFEKKKRELEEKGFVVISKSEFEQSKKQFKKGTKLATYEERTDSHPQIEVETWFDIAKVCRSIAKIGLAYLCYKYGVDKALLPNFDNIRSYILTGKPMPCGMFNYELPYDVWPSRENYHALLLFTADGENVGFMVDFFGVWKSLLSLGTYFKGMPSLDESEITYIDPTSRKVFTTSFSKALRHKLGIQSLKG